MKNKILIGMIIFFAIICLYNIKVDATFEISYFQINCEVQENGDMDIEENIMYYTNENKNGLIRTIETKNKLNSKNSADEIILDSVLVDGVEYKKTASASVGQSGVYTYNGNEIRVFSPFSSNYKTVTYNYKLTDVAVKYNDIAEVYWNFIGSEWDCNINELRINIELPYEASNGTIYVYGHGSDNGTFTKKGNYITLQASDINAYQAVDARILFPRSAIPYSTKTVNKNVLDKYINEEEGISKEQEEPELIFGLSIKELAFGISAIIIVVGIIVYFKYDKEYKVEKYKYFREKPYNLEPEILQRIYYGKNTQNAFWITFLNLIKKGVFKIEKTTNEVGKETENIIFVKDVDDLKPYQETVKKTIKSFMPIKNPSIDLLELQAKMKRSRSKSYTDFVKNLDNEIEILFGENEKAPKKLLTILAICMIGLIALITMLSFVTATETGMGFGIAMFLGITALVYSLFFAVMGANAVTLIFLILHCGAFQIANLVVLNEANLGFMYIPYALLFILIQYVIRAKRKCKEERQIREQIKGLRRYLKDYSLLSEREEISQITIWEDYFILAIALGLNEKVINNWYKYGERFTTSNLGNAMYSVGGYTYIATTIQPAFNSFAHTSYYSSSSGGSSYSGSSGGFSGGSSSGGGGRRRWRRKLFLNAPKRTDPIGADLKSKSVPNIFIYCCNFFNVKLYKR